MVVVANEESRLCEVRAGLLEGRVGENAQKTNRLPPGPAREAHPAQDRDLAVVLGDTDPPREEQQEWRRPEEALRPELEDPRVFEEELAPLGKKEVEAGEVDDLLVGLHLGEVRVHGTVEDDPRAHLPLGVQARSVGTPPSSWGSRVTPTSP